MNSIIMTHVLWGLVAAYGTLGLHSQNHEEKRLSHYYVIESAASRIYVDTTDIMARGILEGSGLNGSAFFVAVGLESCAPIDPTVVQTYLQLDDRSIVLYPGQSVFIESVTLHNGGTAQIKARLCYASNRVRVFTGTINRTGRLVKVRYTHDEL